MEDKLEVGMYVRFKKGKVTYVRKLLEVIHNFETFYVYRTDKEYFDYEENEYFDVVYPDEILGEPSYDITDLIKVGDVLKIIYDNKEFICKVVGGHPKLLQINCNFKVSMGLVNVEEILTHEHFEQNSYKIGE